MPLLNDLSKKLSNVAQSTVQMSRELADSAKVSLAISAEEKEIEKAYKAIGQWYFQKNAQQPDDEIAGSVELIQTSIRKIAELRRQAEEVKTAAPAAAAKVCCPACNAEMDAGTKFCPACGAMMPDETILSREDVPCPQCGTLCSGRFCPNCGTKVKE